MQDNYKNLYLLPRLSDVAAEERQSASSSMGLDEEDFPMYGSMLSPKREEEPTIESCPMAGLQCENPVSIAFDDFGTLLVPQARYQSSIEPDSLPVPQARYQSSIEPESLPVPQARYQSSVEAISFALLQAPYQLSAEPESFRMPIARYQSSIEPEVLQEPQPRYRSSIELAVDFSTLKLNTEEP